MVPSFENLLGSCFPFLLALLFFGEAYPESKLPRLLLKVESDWTGSCSIDSGMIARVCDVSKDEVFDATEINDSAFVDGGEGCSFDSSNLYNFQ